MPQYSKKVRASKNQNNKSENFVQLKVRQSSQDWICFTLAIFSDRFFKDFVVIVIQKLLKSINIQ